MLFSNILMIGSLMVTFALSDQNIEQRVASLIKEQLELHNKEWTQKLEDQKQEFEAKLRILENSCQVKNVQTSSVAFDGHEYPGDIEERVTRLEGFHDFGFNGSSILLLGGEPYGTAATVFNKQGHCGNLTNLPIYTRNAVGAFMNEQPVICSGYDFSKRCFKYQNNPEGLKAHEWIEFARLWQVRYGAAAVVLDSNVLWITGGHDSTANGILKSTEFVNINGEVTIGHDLVERLWGHCMLLTPEVEEQHVFVIGGYNGNVHVTNVRKYLVNGVNTFYIEDGPRFIHKRGYHGCAIFHSENHYGRNIAIIAGGFNGAGPENAIEAWDYQQPGSSWVQIATLPVPMRYQPGVLSSPNYNGVVIVQDEIVLELKAKDGYFWLETLPIRPALARHHAVAMMIPGSVTNC